MKAQVDDLVLWSTNSNWKINIGIVYAIYNGTPYVMPIDIHGGLGRKRAIGFNHMVIGRMTDNGVVNDDRLAKALKHWLSYIKLNHEVS